MDVRTGGIGSTGGWRRILASLLLGAGLLFAAGPRSAQAQGGELRALVEDGRYAEAERLGRELLAGDVAPDAETRLWLASALRRMRDPRDPEILTLTREAVAELRSTLGEAHPRTAMARRELATVLLMQGELGPARELLEQALAVQREHGPPEELGLTLVRLGNWAVFAGDTSLAGTYLARAGEVLAGLPEGRVNDSWRLALEAVLAEQRGDVTAALVLQRRALELREDALRPDHALVGQSLYDLGRLLSLDGDYAEARERVEAALPILATTFGAEHRFLFGPLTLLGGLLDVLGDASSAIPLFERALTFVEEGRVSPTDALTCRLSYARALWGEPPGTKEGRRAYQRFFEASRAQGPAGETVLADGLVLFAGRCLDSGELEPAAEALAEARALLARRPADPLALARLSINEACLHLARGEPEPALAAAEEALALEEQHLGDGHLQLLWPLLAQATAQLRLGEPAAALRSVQRVESISRRNLRANVGGLEGVLVARYAAEARAVSQQALALLFEADGDPAWTEWAFDTVVRRRGLVRDELARRARLAHASTDPEVARLAGELHRARARVANQVFAVLDGVRPPAADHRERLAAAQREQEELESRLVRATRGSRTEEPVEELGADEVRAALGPGDVLVSYALLEEGSRPAVQQTYVAFVLGAEGPVRMVRIGVQDAVDTEVEAWRESLMDLAPGGEERLRRAGEDLRALVLEPALALAGEVQRVWLVPDGALNRIGFASLPGTAGGYLVEEGWTPRVLTAERELVPASESRREGRGLLAVGGPELGEASRGRALVRLPQAEVEAREVVERWHASQARPEDGAQLLLAAEATEAAVRDAMAGKRALHFACHSVSRGDRAERVLVAARGEYRVGRRESRARDRSRSPLAEQGLLLAPGSGVGEDDGFLSAEELAGLDLRGVEWAVLAACSTGQGQVEAGEGVHGLQRALRIAGVRTTVTTLWPVEDESTRRWMAAFHAACLERGESALAAAEEATRTVLAQRRAARESTHPFFWGAFVASGGYTNEAIHPTTER